MIRPEPEFRQVLTLLVAIILVAGLLAAAAALDQWKEAMIYWCWRVVAFMPALIVGFFMPVVRRRIPTERWAHRGMSDNTALICTGVGLLASILLTGWTISWLDVSFPPDGKSLSLILGGDVVAMGIGALVQGLAFKRARSG